MPRNFFFFPSLAAFFLRSAKGSLMLGGADFLMSLELPPTVLFMELYLAWLALRASSLRFFSAIAACFALAAAALFFSASFFACALAASAFLRSASCFAFIALRRASVSMV